jgi:hypothetical protein
LLRKNHCCIRNLENRMGRRKHRWRHHHRFHATVFSSVSKEPWSNDSLEHKPSAGVAFAKNFWETSLPERLGASPPCPRSKLASEIPVNSILRETGLMFL